MNVNVSLPESSERTRVSSLELFFDLVFVFTITQLTAVLSRQPTWKGLFQVSVMLGVIFWMYGGYAWLTNSVALDRLSRRLILLGGMAGFFVVALSVPNAFGRSGAVFGLAYLAVVVIHMGMFARSSKISVVQAMRGLVPFNLSTALLVLAGGILGGTAQYVLWSAAFMIEWISPKLIDDSGFAIEPSHFVERHGLVVLVAIGESVVAVGIGAKGLTVSTELVFTVLLGLALSAGLWWSHFGSNEVAAEEAMAAAPAERRPQMAIDAFGYWHLLILLGVIAMATALRTATGQPFDPLPSAEAIALGGGACSFLLGEALFRRTLAIGAARGRALAALLALATIPVGSELAAVAQIAVLVALLVAMLIAEARRRTARLATVAPSPMRR
jgi:low temperature requirement protein LtrA